jgi:hypothetical protein
VTFALDPLCGGHFGHCIAVFGANFYFNIYYQYINILGKKIYRGNIIAGLNRWRAGSTLFQGGKKYTNCRSW